MDNKVIDQLFRRGSEKGWGVVRFNFRGAGKSTGQFDHGAGETDDFLAVLQWASKEWKRPPESYHLVGYSFGAWIAAKAAAALPKLKSLILIAPPVNLMDFSPLQGTKHSKHVYVAGQDEVIPLHASKTWFHSLTPPKTIQILEKADHFFVGQTMELIKVVMRSLED